MYTIKNNLLISLFTILREFVDAFIYCKKPLIGVINGPAVGISVTVLGMFDSVFCSDQVNFH